MLATNFSPARLRPLAPSKIGDYTACLTNRVDPLVPVKPCTLADLQKLPSLRRIIYDRFQETLTIGLMTEIEGTLSTVRFGLSRRQLLSVKGFGRLRTKASSAGTDPETVTVVSFVRGWLLRKSQISGISKWWRARQDSNLLPQD
jgi:hypothetical protein